MRYTSGSGRRLVVSSFTSTLPPLFKHRGVGVGLDTGA
jgi:hypothetical protein